MPLVDHLLQLPSVNHDRGRLHEQLGLAHLYIADTVAHMLSRPPQRLDHLGVIVDACTELPQVDLVTLNHDLVLEAALRERAVPFADGFEQTNDDVRLWTDTWSDARVRLLKLHGSLDWWGYQDPHEPWRGWITTRYVGNDPMHASRRGFDLPHNFRPIILTGTFDKILAYETWIYPDQHLRFHEGLRDTRRVVVIGYSFGDKAINTRLIGWLARSRDHKLVVCHQSEDAVRRQARGAVANAWSRWRAEGQLAVVPRFVENLNFDHLSKHLSDQR